MSVEAINRGDLDLKAPPGLMRVAKIGMVEHNGLKEVVDDLPMEEAFAVADYYNTYRPDSNIVYRVYDERGNIRRGNGHVTWVKNAI